LTPKGKLAFNTFGSFKQESDWSFNGVHADFGLTFKF